ncbi:MAG: N-acetyltransferase [Kiritimatiellae bacterium]|nr:N-acetyltransferase [Kiritimatiellia bacterium]
MNIRAMTENDRAAVAEVIGSAGVFSAEEQRVAIEMIDSYLRRDGEDYDVAVAEDETGPAAGFVCYGPTPLTEGVWDMYWLAVHGGRRKQGFGRALLAWLEKTAEEKKTRLIVVETSSTPPYAGTRRFYERMGYAETARIRDFYRPGDDRIIYCKYLLNQGGVS